MPFHAGFSAIVIAAFAFQIFLSHTCLRLRYFSSPPFSLFRFSTPLLLMLLRFSLIFFAIADFLLRFLFLRFSSDFVSTTYHVRIRRYSFIFYASADV